jgi:hypothetical protein
MFDRIMRAIKMDKTIFSDVAKDPKLMNEAILIVVIVTVVGALGSLFLTIAFFGLGFLSFILAIINGIAIGWVLWSWVSAWIAKKWQGGNATFQEMLRGFAYATTPRIVGILGFIPFLGWLISLAGSLYSLYLAFLAIKQIQNFDNQKAIINVAIGWAIFLVVGFIISGIIGAATAAFALKAIGL